MRALEAVESSDENTVTVCLCHITQVVKDMQKMLSRMHGELPCVNRIRVVGMEEKQIWNKADC